VTAHKHKYHPVQARFRDIRRLKLKSDERRLVEGIKASDQSLKKNLNALTCRRSCLSLPLFLAPRSLPIVRRTVGLRATASALTVTQAERHRTRPSSGGLVFSWLLWRQVLMQLLPNREVEYSFLGGAIWKRWQSRPRGNALPGMLCIQAVPCPRTALIWIF
jgi:hypothetical protein